MSIHFHPFIHIDPSFGAASAPPFSASSPTWNVWRTSSSRHGSHRPSQRGLPRRRGRTMDSLSRHGWCHGVMGIEPTLPGPKSWLSGGSLISIHKGEFCLHLVLGSHLWRLVESHDACHGWDPICGANTAARASRMVGQWACIKMDTQVMIPAYHWVTGSAWTLNSCKVRDKVG